MTYQEPPRPWFDSYGIPLRKNTVENSYYAISIEFILERMQVLKKQYIKYRRFINSHRNVDGYIKKVRRLSKECPKTIARYNELAYLIDQPIYQGEWEEEINTIYGHRTYSGSLDIEWIDDDAYHEWVDDTFIPSTEQDDY